MDTSESSSLSKRLKLSNSIVLAKDLISRVKALLAGFYWSSAFRNSFKTRLDKRLLRIELYQIK